MKVCEPMTSKKCAETTYTRCEEVGCHCHYHQYIDNLIIIFTIFFLNHPKLFKSEVLRFLTSFVHWLKSLYPLRSLLDYIGADVDADADENYGVIVELWVFVKWCYNEEIGGSSTFKVDRT